MFGLTPCPMLWLEGATGMHKKGLSEGPMPRLQRKAAVARAMRRVPRCCWGNIQVGPAISGSLRAERGQAGRKKAAARKATYVLIDEAAVRKTGSTRSSSRPFQSLLLRPMAAKAVAASLPAAKDRRDAASLAALLLWHAPLFTSPTMQRRMALLWPEGPERLPWGGLEHKGRSVHGVPGAHLIGLSVWARIGVPGIA